MKKSNKEILIAANAAIVEGDYETFLSFCTDDIEWNFVGEQILRGKEAVRAYIAATYKEPPKFNVVNLIEEGDMVVAVGNITLRNNDGKDEGYAYCDVWRFRDGKMAQLKAFVVPDGPSEAFTC